MTNPNMCRTLNLDYFEILSRYKVATWFDRAATQFCVLVGSPFTPSFVRDTVRQHETPLRRALLDPALEPGFAATRMLAARSVACTVACERCSCGEQSGSTPATAVPAYVIEVLRDITGAWRVLKDASLSPTLTGTPDEIYRKEAVSARRWAYCKAFVAAAPHLMITIDNALYAFLGNRLTKSDVDAVWWALRNAGGVEAIRPTKLVIERKDDINTAAIVVFITPGVPGAHDVACEL